MLSLIAWDPYPEDIYWTLQNVLCIYRFDLVYAVNSIEEFKLGVVPGTLSQVVHHSLGICEDVPRVPIFQTPKWNHSLIV